MVSLNLIHFWEYVIVFRIELLDFSRYLKTFYNETFVTKNVRQRLFF